MICSCGRELVFTPETIVGPAVFDDGTYLILVNCSCGSTRAAVMHEPEPDLNDLAQEDYESDLASDRCYELEEANPEPPRPWY